MLEGLPLVRFKAEWSGKWEWNWKWNLGSPGTMELDRNGDNTYGLSGWYGDRDSSSPGNS